VAEWAKAWQSETRPVLVYRTSPGFLQIYDGRHPGHEGTYTFHDTLADIYLACSDRPATAAAVHAKLDLDLPVEAVDDAFAQFQERGLMFLDGNLALALALLYTPAATLAVLDIGAAAEVDYTAERGQWRVIEDTMTLATDGW
jgi:hypothetical protein